MQAYETGHGTYDLVCGELALRICERKEGGDQRHQDHNRNHLQTLGPDDGMVVPAVVGED